ncbi:MAG TPA: hypothetical protein VGH14_13525 [Solirubrobacterales bacterium]|jgi:uncharacterized membrane protein HdeD (DUF308 family)
MAVPLQLNLAAPDAQLRAAPRQIAIVRAAFALVWAAVLVLAVGDKAPTTGSDVPTGAALLLASYPLIDVVASLFSSTFGDARVLRINAAISAFAVIGIGIAAFGSDAGSTLVAFGAWATISGAIQLGVAIHRRRVRGRQLPMIVSGGLSTIAGVSFIAASGNDAAHLATLAGYMALGALLFLLWARRGETGPQAAR